MDSRQAAAAADYKTIKVGSKTYSILLSGNGIPKVMVDSIRDDVQLSAYAVRKTDGTLYLRSGSAKPIFRGHGKQSLLPGKYANPRGSHSNACPFDQIFDLTVYPDCGVADVLNRRWYTNAFYDVGIETAPYFRPHAAVSRAELSVWLYRIGGSPSQRVEQVDDKRRMCYPKHRNAVTYSGQPTPHKGGDAYVETSNKACFMHSSNAVHFYHKSALTARKAPERSVT